MTHKPNNLYVRFLALACELAAHRQRAQNLIEWALLIVVFVAVAAIGLTPLGASIQNVFLELAKKFQPGLPAGF